MKKEHDIKQIDDRILVAACKKNPAAFAALYEKYFEKIFLFIFRRVGDEDLAGDICQEAMLKAMYHIQKYEERGVPFTAWLYRIASNEVNLHFRSAKKNITVEIQERHVKELMQEFALGNIEKEEDQEKLMKHLAQLKPEQAEIIELRFFLEYSFKEIAEFYAITEANAKMRLYRILEKMKADWK